jgi:hypothetical protein
MKRIAIAALCPLFAGFLWAQADQTRTETTTTTTYNGTLVDAGCQSTHTEHRSSETTNPAEGVTKTTTTKTNTESSECPVTTTTTSFGLMTPEGKYVRFDDPSNTKFVEIVKSKKWDRDMEAKKPLKVQVVGMPNGDYVVVKTIK